MPSFAASVGLFRRSPQPQPALDEAVSQTPPSRRVSWLTRLVFALVAVLILKDAWVCDDAYITFRTVDNFIHGYGLTWNVDERVQSYTHPLWMLLLSLFDFCLRNVYLSSIILSLICSLAALYLLVRYLARSPWTAILCLVALAASKTFVDYATSGLEDALTFLLLALFALVYLRCSTHPRATLWLGLLAGLLTLNRMDTVLLVAPALLSVFIQQPHKLRTLRHVAVGFLPFLLWEVFALWYYGFPFPNTAYAKLNTGIPEILLLVHGFAYVIVSTIWFDPMIGVLLLAGLLMPFFLKQQRLVPLALGMLLYVSYTVFIGGDFMAGRFLAAPLFVAVIFLSQAPMPAPRVVWLVAMSICLLIGAFTLYSRWWWTFTPPNPPTQFSVYDQRAFYGEATSIWHMGLTNEVPRFFTARDGTQARTQGQRVTEYGSIGFYGFAAGPGVHVVDLYALSDPLLARLPALPDWGLIGHFERQVPQGYLDTLRQGHNVIIDPAIARYYVQLTLVTRGNLFSWNRLVAIWKLNTGAYNSLLHQPSPQKFPGPFETQIPIWIAGPPGRVSPPLAMTARG